MITRKNAWKEYNATDKKALDKLSQDYMDFISNCKTERECVTESIKIAEKAGYKNLEQVLAKKQKIKAGDKLYYPYMKKSLALFVIGKDNLENGMNILGAHIDSPRIDVKQNPLYEAENLAYFDTHYYGGIKKYQWVTLPLALHGVIVKKDGTIINVNLGEKDDDPTFCISDLLPHLSQEQIEKKAAKVIEGESLDLIIGSAPDKNADKEAVLKSLKSIFAKTYNFDEDDLQSAELEIVPAGRARHLGFDKSMVLGYGQDDRVCAYTSLVAMLEVKDVKRTTCTLLVDKEEIGSVGATGMRSKFFETIVSEIAENMGYNSPNSTRRILANSCMLSSDVSAGYDPLYASAFEKKNASFLGQGIVFNKFTGSRGKSGSNDANAEYIAYVRRLMDDNNVIFQTAELGKVDLGGGGTIAYIMALYGMNVIDCGVAVLSMHAPWEITSKADIYEAKKCYIAFLKGDGNI